MDHKGKTDKEKQSKMENSEPHKEQYTAPPKFTVITRGRGKRADQESSQKMYES